MICSTCADTVGCRLNPLLEIIWGVKFGPAAWETARQDAGAEGRCEWRHCISCSKFWSQHNGIQLHQGYNGRVLYDLGKGAPEITHLNECLAYGLSSAPSIGPRHRISTTRLSLPHSAGDAERPGPELRVRGALEMRHWRRKSWGWCELFVYTGPRM